MQHPNIFLTTYSPFHICFAQDTKITPNVIGKTLQGSIRRQTCVYDEWVDERHFECLEE